jgi:hypothetical protein
MFKGKFVVLSLIAVALLCWQILPTTVDTVNSGIVEPCSSSASSAGGCVLVCPQGDGDRLDALGATISVVVKDQAGAPIPGIPGADFWLMGCNDPGLVLCGGGGSINADAATDINGETTIVNDFAAGGCDSVGVVVVVQGVVIEDINNNCNPLCLPIVMVSPDIDASLLVDVVDLGLFSINYTAPVPKGYVACLDYNCDGAIDLVDFSLFSQHYLHLC